jgi:hypothetical protein
MMMKKLLIAAMIAASLGSAAVPAAAQSRVIVVREAPPEPRSERTPPPRRGYVWAPGYWDWRSNHHVWVRGHWVRARSGYAYNQPACEEREGQWHMRRGGWERTRRDRDGDGVPNRYDERPNNPNRQ